MAELVAAIGVPHSPHYPAQYPKDGPESTSQNFRAIKAHLDAAKADAIVVIANDHFNTFFMLDALPNVKWTKAVMLDSVTLSPCLA